MSDRTTHTLLLLWARLRRDDGQAMTEYALVLTILAAAVILGMGALTGQLTTWMNSIVSDFPGAG